MEIVCPVDRQEVGKMMMKASHLPFYRQLLPQGVALQKAIAKPCTSHPEQNITGPESMKGRIGLVAAHSSEGDFAQ